MFSIQPFGKFYIPEFKGTAAALTAEQEFDFAPEEVVSVMLLRRAPTA